MRESQTLEFKETVSNTFLKTVSAFANYNGGTVLFGVRDDGTPVGMEHPDEVCLAIENIINDSIRPQPNYSLEVRSTDNVVSLTVKPGKTRLILINRNFFSRWSAFRNYPGRVSAWERFRPPQSNFGEPVLPAAYCRNTGHRYSSHIRLLQR